MTRNKVKLTYILNDTARKTTFKKRKIGIVKKIDELTTLCGIEACTIIYSAFEPQPLVWPSLEEAQRLIMKFKNFSEVDRMKRKVNQETFTRERLQKMEEKLRKQQRENRHKEMTHTMFQLMMDPQTKFLMLNMRDYEELTRVTNENLMEVERMMEMRNRSSSSFNPPPSQEGTDEIGGASQLVLSHHEFMPLNHGMFQSSSPSQSGTGGQQLGIHGFMPPNHVRFQASSSGGSGGGRQPFLSHEFMPLKVESSSPGFSMTYPPPPIMAFPPPTTSLQPDNIGFSLMSTDLKRNDMPSYMHSNIGMPYPSNQPAFPYYHNVNKKSPHDPSLH